MPLAQGGLQRLHSPGRPHPVEERTAWFGCAPLDRGHPDPVDGLVFVRDMPHP
ncbi:hypothetical protein [Streptomyces sp. E5N91]|uniref:hypothetical protein n=1 Tax=Streptomyces sp. E5N91 TaxID=1851996 RepID=UPI00187D624B|nr:hypothetical protein [Streptomyces sp. E5N91]